MSKCHCGYNGCQCSTSTVQKAAATESRQEQLRKQVDEATRPQFGRLNPEIVELREAEGNFDENANTTGLAIRRGPFFKEGVTSVRRVRS